MEKQRGFTLMELVIVTAIIGILSSIALPAYKKFTVRARVTEGLILAAGAKMAVVETYTVTTAASIAPYDGTGNGVSGSYGYSFTPIDTVASIAIAAVADTGSPVLTDAQITITFAGSVAASVATLTLVPGSGTIDSSSGIPIAAIAPIAPIVWGCTVASADEYPFVPARCRFGGA